MYWHEVAILNVIKESPDPEIAQSQIADLAALSLHTVQRHICVLALRGVIEIERPIKGTCYRYRINREQAKEEYGI